MNEVNKHFKVVVSGKTGNFIIVRTNGTQFTTNEFDNKAEADAFLKKIAKHAKEFMEQIERHGDN